MSGDHRQPISLYATATLAAVNSISLRNGAQAIRASLLGV
jgi:hypothetical protein